MMSFEAQPNQLQKFEVHGLFGTFDHVIPCDLANGITPIIAPNGHGKTVLLRMIDAMYSRRWKYFHQVEFGEAHATFFDGSTLKIVPDGTEVEITFTTGSHPRTWRFPERRESLSKVLTRLARWKVSGVESWQALSADEVASLERTAKREDNNEDELSLVKWLGDRSSLFVPVQRLTSKLSIPEVKSTGGNDSVASVVDQLSQTLKKLIQRNDAVYTQLAEESDRTFPQRVLENADTESDEADVRTRLGILEGKRDRLVQAGILNPTEGPVGLGSRSYGKLLPVLSLYVADTERKLSVFDDLLARVLLFSEIINSRFAGHKTLKVDREKGLTVQAGTRVVPLAQLSSGEQHLLVLIFNLLFGVSSGSVVLIDEPELSLHVSWQRRFLSDLERVVSLNPCQVILATHSIQLLASYGDRAVMLGEVDGPEGDDCVGADS